MLTMLLKKFIYLFIGAIAMGFNSSVSTRELNGAHLTLIAVNSPPHLTVKRQSNGTYKVGGSHPKMNEWMSQRFNYTFAIMPLIDEPLVQKLGIILAAFDIIMNKQADGCLDLYTMTEDRAKILDLTEVWQEPYALIVPSPQEASRLLSFMKPWQPTVWLCIFGSAVVVAIMMRLFSLIYTNFMSNATRPIGDDNSQIDYGKAKTEEVRALNQINNVPRGLAQDILYVVNTLTNQGFYLPYSPWSFRILASGWLLAALVVVNTYSGTVVSYMALPLVKPPINSLEDLAASNEVDLLLCRDHVVTYRIWNATSGVLRTLGNKLRERPDKLMNTTEEIYSKLLAGGSNYAYIYFRNVIGTFVFKINKANGQRQYCSSDPIQSLGVAHLSLVFQKNSKYTPYIRKGVLEMWSFGLIPFWGGEEQPRIMKCFAENSNNRHNRAIKLEDLIGAFFILGIGSGCALLSFLTELLIFRFTRRNATKHITVDDPLP